MRIETETTPWQWYLGMMDEPEPLELLGLKEEYRHGDLSILPGGVLREMRITILIAGFRGKAANITPDYRVPSRVYDPPRMVGLSRAIDLECRQRGGGFWHQGTCSECGEESRMLAGPEVCYGCV